MNFDYQAAMGSLFLSSAIWTVAMFALTGFSLWTGLAGLLTTVAFVTASMLQSEDTEELTDWEDE